MSFLLRPRHCVVFLVLGMSDDKLFREHDMASFLSRTRHGVAYSILGMSNGVALIQLGDRALFYIEGTTWCRPLIYSLRAQYWRVRYDVVISRRMTLLESMT